jgi:hypothetical protein
MLGLSQVYVNRKGIKQFEMKNPDPQSSWPQLYKRHSKEQVENAEQVRVPGLLILFVERV